tara:strand:- start:5569 stop:5817 length:249 start_codon:yes stop_codon:yes gene_type:complete
METQRNKIRQYLESGKSLTPILALKKFNSMRLASHIHALKTQGIPINQKLCVNEKGNRYAEYWIDVVEWNRIKELSESFNDK